MKTADEQIAELQGRAAAGGAVDSLYARPAADANDGLIFVFDDALGDPTSYRRNVLSQPFRSVTVGAATFRGISECHDQRVPMLIAAHWPNATPTMTFFRKSPEGQEEPNFIHTDRDMGEWTAILYLTPRPPDGDGTTFWRHRETGARASIATTQDDLRAEWLMWRDIEQWEPWTTVEAKENRLVLFSAPLFHSRALRENYGHGDEARLTQLVFGVGDLS